jgi:Ca2+-binding RTX toxin-like protein
MGVPVNLNLHLSDKFVEEVTKTNSDFTTGNGVNAYLWYNKGSQPFTQIVDNGSLVSGQTISLQLTDGSSAVVGGKVYLLVQSEANGTHNDLVTKIGANENLINQSNAILWDFGYDTFEVTLQNPTFDVANLSAIDNFSHQLGVSVTYANGTTSARGYAKSAIEFDNLIKAEAAKVGAGKDPLAPWPDGSTGASWHTDNDTQLVITPASYGKGVPEHEAFTPADWRDYVNAVYTLAQTNSPIEVSGMFNGAPDDRDHKKVWHNPGYFSYTLQTKEITAASGSTLAPGSYFMLVANASSQVQGYIFITKEAMEQNLYKPGLTGSNVEAYLFEDADAKNPFNIDGTSPDGSFSTGENNAWGKVFTTLFTGFSGGYLGAEADSVLGHATTLEGTAIDLNKSYNWDPTYAFDGLRSNAKPTYQHFDPYAKLFFDYSNVYGGAYSDALTSRFDTSVLIPVGEKGANGFQNVSAIDLWVFGRDETMGNVPGTSTPFYTQNIIKNVIAPPSGQDYGKVTLVGNSVTPNFVVSLASNGMILDTDTMDVKIGFYLGDGKFQYVSIPKGADQHGGGFWQVWKVVEDTTKADGSRFSLESVPSAGHPPEVPATPYTPSTEGNFTITSLPTVKDSTLIYQVVVGNASVGEKTFNVTVKTDSASKWTDFAVDGMGRANATFDGGASVDAFTVVVLDGVLEALPGAMLEPDTSDNFISHMPFPPKTAPVAGHGTGSSFVALAGQTDKYNIKLDLNGTDTLGFAWTGRNSDINVPSWISDITNKVHAGYTAKVSIERSTDNGTTYTAWKTLTGVGDLDGQWTTSTTAQFADSGLYRVTMTEFTPGANGAAYSVPTPSLLLNFTIATAMFRMAQIGTMTPDALSLLDASGTDVIDVHENTATITLAQALALGEMIMHPWDRVTVAGTGAEFAALTTAQIANLAKLGADTIDATDDQMDLTLGQLLALGKTKLTPGDDIVLRDTGEMLGSLSTGFFGSLAARGIDGIDATDDVLELTLKQVQALGAVTLDPADQVTVTATGLAISLLTVAQLEELDSRGVDVLDATSGIVTMSLPRFEALGNIKLGADDKIVLLGGFGNDTIDVTEQPFGADDYVLGGTGSDTYKLGASGAKVAELIFSGQDTIESSVSYVLPANVEALVLTGTDDIDGTASNTSAAITGNVGNNVLTGRNGEDSLSGGEGNDVLVGGRGADELSGGAGGDAFRILGTKDGMDTILDYDGDDWIEIALAGFPVLGATGALGAGQFSLDAPVGKVAQFVYDTATGLLAWDADGTGAKAATPLALLMGAPALTATDILVV